MNVICLEEPAFQKLLDEVIGQMEDKLGQKEDRWISEVEGMKKMRILSRSTMQRLRKEGKIGFSHPERKMILYDAISINAYLEKHHKKP